MSHMQKLRILKRVSSNFVCSHITRSSSSLPSMVVNPRFYRTKRIVQIENGESIKRISKVTRREAQAALLDYFHYTRNLKFTDAESLSKFSPHFLEKLLEKVDIDVDIGHSVTRFLRFHPINEFEPFFESLGLKPREYSPLLPRDLMFLCDDELLLDNYHALCDYGIARSKIGKIYKGAKEVFGYDNGVLLQQLKAYEELGLSRSFVIKLVVSSPYLLIGEVNVDFNEVLEILRKVGVEIGQIEGHLSEKSFYDWSKLLALLRLFRHTGCDDKQLGGLMNQHMGIWFEDSVDRIYLLIGFLLKFGSTVKQICSLFSRFPQMKFEKFVSNLRRCFLFLNEIGMEGHEIGFIFHFHPILLGSCQLRKASTLALTLKAGKKRMCEVIQENPLILKKWVMGSQAEPLPKPERGLRLKPHECSTLLLDDMMFLCDDDLFLENYHALCSYGITRSKIGKIFEEATEVFGYDYGALVLKLKAYEDLGLTQSFMIKLVVCSPYLLIGEVDLDFIKVLEMLRKGGVEIGGIEEHLPEKSFYNWSKLLALLNVFRRTGFNEKHLGGMMRQNLGIWFGDSVDRIYLLIGFLLKFGCTMKQIFSLFSQFPQMQFEKFVSNLRRSFMFLKEIKMEGHEIGNIFCSHPLMLGSCKLKASNSMIVTLKAGKQRICEVIKENPKVLRKWVIGSEVKPFPSSRRKSQKLKAKFLLDLGIVENSYQIERALKYFKGSGREIQARFDYLVEAGLDRKDVCAMIKKLPQILSMKKDVLKMKIGFLVNDMGYPISYLVNYSNFLCLSMQRTKLRIAMYNWLKDQGKMKGTLSLYTLFNHPDKQFISQYVNRHPRGPEMWQDLKKEIYAE